MNGHDTADIWLTAVELKGGQLKNSVSMDQLIGAACETEQTAECIE